MPSLSALLQRAVIDDHEAILNACDSIIKQSKGDIEAQRVKCLALLKLERYEEALRILEEADEPVKRKCQLERAYALYKHGDLQQAKDLAKQVANRGARHVEAQASYRLEEFADAVSLYENLEREAAIENEENDVRINRGATSAQVEWQGHGHLIKKKKPSREDQEAFETAFNAACASIARGELEQGELLLKRAKDLCNLSDELSDQEKATEILPITVQQLYILRRLGKTEEAERVASQIVLQEITDLSTRQIAQSNKFASTSKPPNPFLTHRLFQSTPILPKSDRLFQFQTDLIQENSMALDLMVLKYSDVIQHASRICSSLSFPTTSAHINKISVLSAAAHAQNQLAKLGLKQILPLVEKRPHDIGLVLTIIQLYMLTNNPGSAITVLESLLKRLAESASPTDQDVLFAPGLIATLVSLYTSEGRKSQIVTTLAKAASYWRHKSKPPIPLLEAAGLTLLKSQVLEHHQLALDIFSSLRSLNSSSRLANAGYVAAHTLTSSETSDSPPETNTLTPVPRLVANIDAVALEAAGVPSRTAADPTASAALAASRKRALNEAPKPAKKRVRKSRLPKTYDPEKPPDPERWLPLRDRSSYKPKGKKGRQKAAALTQGGVSSTSVAASAGGRGANEGAGAASKPAPSSEGVIKAGNAPAKSKKKKGKK